MSSLVPPARVVTSMRTASEMPTRLMFIRWSKWLQLTICSQLYGQSSEVLTAARYLCQLTHTATSGILRQGRKEAQGSWGQLRAGVRQGSPCRPGAGTQRPGRSWRRPGHPSPPRSAWCAPARAPQTLQTAPARGSWGWPAPCRHAKLSMLPVRQCLHSMSQQGRARRRR